MVFYLTGCKSCCFKHFRVPLQGLDDGRSSYCCRLHLVETLILYLHISAVIGLVILGASAGIISSSTFTVDREWEYVVFLIYGLVTLSAIIKLTVTLCIAWPCAAVVALVITMGQIGFAFGVVYLSMRKVDSYFKMAGKTPSAQNSTTPGQQTTAGGVTAGMYASSISIAIFVIFSLVELVLEFVVLFRYCCYVRHHYKLRTSGGAIPMTVTLAPLPAVASGFGMPMAPPVMPPPPPSGVPPPGERPPPPGQQRPGPPPAGPPPQAGQSFQGDARAGPPSGRSQPPSGKSSQSGRPPSPGAGKQPKTGSPGRGGGGDRGGQRAKPGSPHRRGDHRPGKGGK